MIVKFKIFENLEDIHEIEVGDYVIIKPDQKLYSEEFNHFLKTNISKIFNIQVDKYNFMNSFFTAKPEESGFWSFPQIYRIKDIEYWSKNKEDLEIVLTSRKYNL